MWELCGSRHRPRQAARPCLAAPPGQPRRSVGHGTCARSAAAGGGAGETESDDGDDDGAGGGAAGVAENDGGAGTGGGGESVAAGNRCSRGSFGAPRSVRTRSEASGGAGTTTTCERTGGSGAVQRPTTNDTPKTTITTLAILAAQRITDGLRRLGTSSRVAPHDPRDDRAVPTL